MSYINSNDVYAVKCDDILGNYIGFRNSGLKAFATNMGMSEEVAQNIPDSIDFSVFENIMEITPEQKQHISDTYSKVIFDSIDKTKFTKLNKAQISVDGTSYAANVYQLALDQNTIKQIVINCLQTLQTDNSTLVLISNKLSSLGIDSNYTDITKISEYIGNFSSQIQNATSQSNDVIITINVYASKGKTIRTELVLPEQNKITIDSRDENGVEKAILTIETISSANTTNVIEITLQKITTNENISNEIILKSSAENDFQTITLNNTMGKLVNNKINNTSEITFDSSSDENNLMLQTLYTQTIEPAVEVEDIMELTNSNTVIFNNYTQKQLVPFLDKIEAKIEEVIPNKIAGLFTTPTNNSTNNSIARQEN